MIPRKKKGKRRKEGKISVNIYDDLQTAATRETPIHQPSRPGKVIFILEPVRAGDESGIKSLFSARLLVINVLPFYPCRAGFSVRPGD